MFPKTIRQILIVALFGCTLILLIGHMIFAYRLFVMGVDTRLVIGDFINFNLVGWFYLDNERFFGAIFSSLLLLGSSALMLMACLRARPDKMRMLGWAAMSMMLFYLAADEYLSIHERAFRFLGNREAYDGMVPAWMVSVFYGGLVIGALMMIPITWLWLKLPTKLRLNMAIAAGVFVLGAIVVDELTSALGLHGNRENLSYISMVALEEGLEMIGEILLIRALLLYPSWDQSEVGTPAPLADASA